MAKLVKGEQNGWNEYSKLVIAELERLNDGITNLNTEIQDLKREIAELKIREDFAKELWAWKKAVDEVVATLPPSFCFSTKAQIKALLFCMSVFAVELRVRLLVTGTQSCPTKYPVLKSIVEKKSEVASAVPPSPPKAVLLKTATSMLWFEQPSILSEALDIVPVSAVVSKQRNVLLIAWVREPRLEVAVYDIA